MADSIEPQYVMSANSNDIEEKSSLENLKKLVLDNSSSKNINNINISKKCNNKSSNMLRKTSDIFDDKSFETDIDSSQLTKEEYEYLKSKLTKCDVECADVDSEEEKVLTKITEKVMKSNFLTTSDGVEINTQQFMELVVQQAEQLIPSLDVVENQTCQHTDSDNSSVIPHTSENLNNTCSTVNLNEDSNSELSKEHDPESIREPNQHQNPELVAFKAMCEAMLKTKVINIDNGILRTKVSNELTNNQGKHETTISCVDSMESSSKSNSGVNSKCTKDIDISKLKRKHSSTLNLSDKSSPKYFNEVSQIKDIHQCNEATDNGNSICELNNKKKRKNFILEQIDDRTRRCVEYTDYEPSARKLKKAVISNNAKNTGNILKRESKHDSPELIISDDSSPEFLYKSLHKPCNKAKALQLSLKTRNKRCSNQSNDPKKIKPITVILSDDEEDFVLAKVQSSVVKNPLNHKKNKLEPCEQKHVREFKPLYTCVPNGQIHKDMLDFISRKKN